jgi:hypothetical protein
MSVEDQNPSPNHGTEIFRPYARLISILGDQLITSKWVGVIELVKNCYDADANDVSVRFLGFDDITQSPVIEIEDDGDGMSLDTILNVWMKPATPNKINKKKSKELRFTKKGRLMQGDKGVGRFAVYKLGNVIEIFTKTPDSTEVNLSLNFREYAQDDEFAEEEKIPEKFLDEIENEWKLNEIPIEINNKEGKGTLIRISDLRSRWAYGDLLRLKVAFQRMIPPIIPEFKNEIVQDFDIKLFWNDYEYQNPSAIKFEEVVKLAPFKFVGSIDEKGVLRFTYNHDKKKVQKTVDLFDADDAKSHDLWNLKLFKDQFLKPEENEKTGSKIIVQKKSKERYVARKNTTLTPRRPEVGPCSFFFYAFDWKDTDNLSSEEEAFIRENSIYLYRDFTRVYPYGEKGNDWLKLSKGRAEDKAGRYFSYNDLLGFIFITQEHNPNLRDQASREGLVNIDGASDDFVALMQVALKVMKDLVTIDKTKDRIKREKTLTTFDVKFNDAFEQLRQRLNEISDEKSLEKAEKFVRATNDLVEQYKSKVIITEELAGLGMAVEKSSHDVFMLINRMIENAHDIVKRYDRGNLSGIVLKQFFEDLIENLEFIYQELQIFQPLLRESRKVSKEVSVKETIERVERYFRRDLQFNINFKFEGADDLIITTNLGLLLQVFLNLIDNAIYWLNNEKSGKREIRVKIDAENRRVIVADSGPDISEDVSDIIFLEFYTTKEDGRGLGLYIVKELLDRINANISLIKQAESKILPGANFLIQFDEDN